MVFLLLLLPVAALRAFVFRCDAPNGLLLHHTSFQNQAPLNPSKGLHSKPPLGATEPVPKRGTDYVENGQNFKIWKKGSSRIAISDCILGSHAGVVCSAAFGGWACVTQCVGPPDGAGLWTTPDCSPRRVHCRHRE